MLQFKVQRRPTVLLRFSIARLSTPKSLKDTLTFLLPVVHSFDFEKKCRRDFWVWSRLSAPVRRLRVELGLALATSTPASNCPILRVTKRGKRDICATAVRSYAIYEITRIPQQDLPRVSCKT